MSTHFDGNLVQSPRLYYFKLLLWQTKMSALIYIQAQKCPNGQDWLFSPIFWIQTVELFVVYLGNNSNNPPSVPLRGGEPVEFFSLHSISQQWFTGYGVSFVVWRHPSRQRSVHLALTGFTASENNPSIFGQPVQLCFEYYGGKTLVSSLHISSI